MTARAAFERWLRLIESDICCPIEGCGRVIPERGCDAQHGCRQRRRQQWEQCVAGVEAALEPFQLALAHLYAHHQHSFEDLLGPVFSELGLGGGRSGIYFTPWNVARMMAHITGGDLREFENQPTITMADPACGSGVMLLAFLEHVNSTRPDLYDRVRVYGMDINDECVRMCRIALRLVAIARAERLVDAYDAGDLSAALDLQAAAAETGKPADTRERRES